MDKVSYQYDESGNIVLEEHFANNSGKEYLYMRYTVEYEKAKGNDDTLLWNQNNWLTNLLFSQRSYMDYIVACYQSGIKF